MSWGTGPWGAGSAWGTGADLPPPTLLLVQSDPGPVAPVSGPAVVDVLGGTVCRLFGTNFFAPMTVELGIGGGGSFAPLAEGVIVDYEFDLVRNALYFGCPRLEAGLYSLRATTPGGSTGVLHNVVDARPFADEHKTASVRSKFAPKWSTGPRILS